jgi:rubredoxin
MSERATLRGSRLGGTSFEDESGIEFAPRQMAEEAEVPFLWECPRCGAESRQRDGSAPDVKLEKPARTHWDMLLERRSIPELEDILSERLELLRNGDIGPAHLHRRGAGRTTKPKARKTA